MLEIEGSTEIVLKMPQWVNWLSFGLLTFAFTIGLPLNAATILIFIRKKKLRHLVNFVLLLDCTSHLLLCFIAIPVQIFFIWCIKSLPSQTGQEFQNLIWLQQIIEDFVNHFGLLLAVSTALLRFRRLCWKKKDKFNIINAIKWTFGPAVVGISMALLCGNKHLLAAQFHWENLENFRELDWLLYCVKMGVILTSIFLVLFCYVFVSRRILSHEKEMDPLKLKKSRSIHMRVTVHSCVQIILLIVTMTPYTLNQTMKALMVNKSFDGFPHHQHHHQVDFENKNWNSNENDRGEERNYFLSTTRTFGLALNYTLLAIGTPMAYIASCNSYREQFKKMFLWSLGSYALNQRVATAQNPNHNHNNGSMDKLSRNPEGQPHKTTNLSKKTNTAVQSNGPNNNNISGSNAQNQALNLHGQHINGHLSESFLNQTTLSSTSYYDDDGTPTTNTTHGKTNSAFVLPSKKAKSKNKGRKNKNKDHQQDQQNQDLILQNMQDPVEPPRRSSSSNFGFPNTTLSASNEEIINFSLANMYYNPFAYHYNGDYLKIDKNHGQNQV